MESKENKTTFRCVRTVPGIWTKGSFDYSYNRLWVFAGTTVIIIMSEWVSAAYRQMSTYIMTSASCIRWDDNDVHFVLDQLLAGLLLCQLTETAVHGKTCCFTQTYYPDFEPLKYLLFPLNDAYFAGKLPIPMYCLTWGTYANNYTIYAVVIIYKGK